MNENISDSFEMRAVSLMNSVLVFGTYNEANLYVFDEESGLLYFAF